MHRSRRLGSTVRSAHRKVLKRQLDNVSMSLTQTLADWATAQQMTTRCRQLKAVSLDVMLPSRLLCESDCEETTSSEAHSTASKTSFSIYDWSRTNPLIYKLNASGTYFRNHNHWYYWSNGQRDNRCGVGYDRTITIRCFGRSPQPIKNILQEIQDFILVRDFETTEVYRPATKIDGQSMCWLRHSIRPARPMDTVSLEEKQKRRLIHDMNEYLQPATARWYTSRGIPYRRGYLFFGPSGTGKTSLSFALAGAFRLNIYCISLSEAELTELDLATLFRRLPERCIVLLEDIDSAGLHRACNGANVGGSVSTSALSSSGSETPSARTKGVGSKARIRKVHSPACTGKDKTKSRITLAALLNIIDGAASKEGRLLIMTTNYSQAVDSALIRPGRIDLQVQFTLATKTQIYDIYKSMYNPEAKLADPVRLQQDGHDHRAAKVKMHSSTAMHVAIGPGSEDGRLAVVNLSYERLEVMAKEFADQLPPGIFSPAEIQGFLLERKFEPLRALQEVSEWVCERSGQSSDWH